MGRIAKLSVHLVNKIAAGEVIERPASVVKELVENALDAGASRIDVTIEDGGAKLIQVTDNGGGMGREDAELAFAPHATSKIATDDDLFSIHTMGFRGEALASIASISHAQIRTRQPDAQEGWEILASGEQIEPPTPCAAPPGTTVTIRDLFFNTPARRKFLRTTNTEFGHVTEQLTRLALPHPHVAFTLRHNGRETLNLPPTESTASRVADLFTPDLADGLLPVVPRGGEVQINGLIGMPSSARSSAKWQYLFLNGRFIRDRLLGHALREAYRGLLMPTKYPVLFLFLEVAPDQVDVNVHPTKVEVRFRDSNQVYGALLATLRETLNRADLHRQADLDQLDEQPKDSAAVERQTSLRQAMADFFKSAPPPQSRLALGEGVPAFQPRSSQTTVAPSPCRPMPFEVPDAPTTATPQEAEPVAAPPAAGSSEENEYTLSPPANARPILQIHDSYIVAQTDEGLMIVDQHALHERILYNEFRNRMLNDSGRLAGQAMLIPQTLSVTPAEQALLTDAAETLGRLGFSIEPFGPNTVAVQKYPTVLSERKVAVAPFLREVLDRLQEDETLDDERILEAILATMACKAAVKAGDPLTIDEMDQLLASAVGIDKASSCPHGRPTTLRMSLRDLEKQFQRRV